MDSNINNTTTTTSITTTDEMMNNNNGGNHLYEIKTNNAENSESNDSSVIMMNNDSKRFNLRTRKRKNSNFFESNNVDNMVHKKSRFSNDNNNDNGAKCMNGQKENSNTNNIDNDDDNINNNNEKSSLNNGYNNGEKHSKRMVIYKNNSYLAVRNEHNSFYLCQAKQNIYKNGRKIKIKWFSNDDDENIYRPDYDNYIDFESILTDVRVKREKDGVSLPDGEKNRALNILQRALDVEKGIDLPPDPRSVLSDGVDISIISEVDDDDVLCLFKNHDKGTKKKSTKQLDNKSEKMNNGTIRETSTSSSVANNNNNAINDLQKQTSESNISPPKKENEPIVDSFDDKNHVDTDPSKPLSKCTEKTANNYVQIECKHVNKKAKKTSLPFISSFVSSKSLINAIKSNDHESLKKISEKNHANDICSISIPHSITIRKNAIHYAILKEDLKSIQLLKEIENNIPNFDNHLSCSIELDHCELMMDKSHYSTRKEFLLDQSYIEFSLKQNVKLSFIEKLRPFLKTDKSIFDLKSVIMMIKRGNHEKVSQIIDQMCQNRGDYRTFQLIKRSLKSKITSNYDNKWLEIIDNSIRLYPIHVAAINPDPSIFYHITSISSKQIYQNDCQNWSPIHFASVCQTFFNLKHLLNLGVSACLIDSKGNTPLHLASKYNRLHNADLIIKYESSKSGIFYTYNYKGYIPFHVACQKGHIELVKLFINNEIEIDFASSTHSSELTALMIATKYGHLNVVKLLIDQGATINIFDKKNRSALTHAVIEGHLDIVTYFLEIGMNPSHKDIFGNNLFHYALAYGWYSCFELLLKTNINLKDTNTFGLTPIYAAFMKGHIGFIQYILKKHILNVNVPVNDAGINLTMLTCSNIANDFNCTTNHLLQLFVGKYKCDLLKFDYEKNNALHYLLKHEAKYRNNETKNSSTVINDNFENALHILIENGCDIYLKNENGISPIEFSLSNQLYGSFSCIFLEHYNTKKFTEELKTNEHLWPMIISNILNEIHLNENNSITFGQFIIKEAIEDSNLYKLLMTLSLKTNSNGDLPIEIFIKLSKHIKLAGIDKDNYIVDFFNFLAKFYDNDFINDLNLLHLAAEYAPKCIIEQLLKNLKSSSTTFDVPNESDQTPLMIALISDNNDAIETFLSSTQINIDYEIDNVSCFFYYLKNCTSLRVCSKFLKFGAKLKSLDKMGNTCLHLICANIERPYFIETLKSFLENGVDIGKINYQGQTALHVAFANNKFSSTLISALNILMSTNKIDLYVKDLNGYNAFNYLFMNDASIDPLDLFIKMDRTNKLNLSEILDAKQMNLLHYAAKKGFVKSLTYFLQYIDPNLVDYDNYSPLSLAILNGHQECTMILLKSKKNQILDNLEFILRKNIKINLLSHILENNWKDALFLIEEKAIQQKEMNELIQISIKSQCLSYTTKLIQSNKSILKEYDRIYLQLFAKYTSSELSIEVQNEFLKHFHSTDLLSTIFVDIFKSAFQNWNSKLCDKLIKTYGIDNIWRRIKEKNVKLLPLCFKRLIYNNRDLPEDMMNLIELFLQKNDCHNDINVLSSYPIRENENFIKKRYQTYSEYDDRYQNCFSSIKYSPLIIAIIMKSYSTVEWLLKLQVGKKFIVDMNFCDSNERTPLMHAILVNNTKIIQLFLDNANTRMKNETKLRILKRDINQMTVFHYLISPFKFGNYLSSNIIYSELWNMMDIKSKSETLINELYKFAVDRNAAQLIEFMEETILHLNKKSYVIPNHHNLNEQSLDCESTIESLGNENNVDFNHSTLTSNLIHKIIIKNENSQTPFDVMFTKLEYENYDYVYHFYKMRLSSYGNVKYCLSNCWGIVGTTGNTMKIYYDSKEKSIEKFKMIFKKKSGIDWDECNDEYVENKLKAGENNFETISNNYDDKFFEKIHSSLNHLKCNDNFKKLLQKFMKIFRMEIDTNNIMMNKSYKFLNKKSIDNCLFILNRLSKLITFKNLNRNENISKDRKLFHDIIDLSENFYYNIKIYGQHYDRLKPIFEMETIIQMVDIILRLKTMITTLESLQTIFKDPNVKFDSLLSWQCTKLNDLHEIDFIYTYLNVPDNYDFDNDNHNDQNYGIYKFTNNEPSSVESSQLNGRYLLWYRMRKYEFINFFINGFDARLLFLDSKLTFILNGVCMTNKIHRNDDTKDDIYIICEALIQNPIEIDNTFDTLTYENYENMIKNKDCIILSTNNYDQQRIDDSIQWNGCIVPIDHNDDNVKQFIHLKPNQLKPRYLLVNCPN